MKLFLLFLVTLLLHVQASAQVYYYSTASNSSPTTLSNWNSARNGTGVAPASFTTAAQVFVIQDGHTVTRTSGGWTISGTGSYLWVEPGGTYTSTSTTGATLTITLTGTETKPATWNQTNGYANVTISGGNAHSKLNLFSPANYRFEKSFPGSVHLRATSATTFFGSTTGLNVGGDFIIGTNTTFIANNGANALAHTVGGSFIIRGGTYSQTGNTGSTSFSVGHSFLYESGTLQNGSGSGHTTYTLGTVGQTDTISLSSAALNTSVEVAAGANVLLASNTILNGGILTTGAGSSLNLGSAVLSGTTAISIGAGTTLKTTHEQGLSGSLQHSGSTTFLGLTHLHYSRSGPQSAGLVLLPTLAVGKLLVTGGSTALTVDRDVTVLDSLVVPVGCSLDYSSTQLTLSGVVQISGSFNSGTPAKLIINGTGSIQGLALPSSMASLTLGRAGYTLYTNALTVAESYVLTAGTHRVQSGTLLLTGAVQLASGLDFGATANLSILGTGAATGTLQTDTIQHLTINRTGGMIGMSAKLNILGNVTVLAGTVDASGDSLVMWGDIYFASNGVVADAQTSISVRGAGSVDGLGNLTTIKHFTLNRSGLTLVQNTDLVVNGHYNLTSGIHDIRGRSITWYGDVVLPTNAIADANTSISVQGTGALAAIPFTSLNNVTHGRNAALFFGQNITINGTLAITGGPGNVNVNGKVVELKGVISGRPTLQVSGSTHVTISGSGSCSKINFSGTVGTLTITRTGVAVPLGTFLTISGALSSSAGTIFDFSDQRITAAADINLLGQLKTNTASALIINGTGSMQFLDLDTIGNFTLNRVGTDFSLAKSLLINGGYTAGNGTVLRVNEYDLTLAGAISNSGSLITTGQSGLHITGSGSTGGMALPAEVNHFTLTRAVSMTIPSSMVVRGTFTLGASSTLVISGNTFTLLGGINALGTITSNNLSTLNIEGSGAIVAAPAVSTLAHFTLNRTAQPCSLTSNLVCSGTFTQSAGSILVLGTRTLTWSGSVNAAGTIDGNRNSGLVVNNSGNFICTAAIDTVGTLNLSRSGMNFTQVSDLVVTTSFTIGNGVAHNIGSNWLTVEGSLTKNGTCNGGPTSSLALLGTGSVSAFSEITELNNLYLNRGSLDYIPGTILTVWGDLSILSVSTINVFDKTLVLYGNINAASSRFRSNQGSNYEIRGTGAINGITALSTIGALTIDRPATPYELTVTQQVWGPLYVAAGSILDINTGSLFLKSNIDIQGTILANALSSLGVEGSGTISNDKLERLSVLKNFGHNRPGNTWTQRVDVVYHGNVFIGANSPTVYHDVSVTFHGNYVSNLGFIHNAGTSLHMLGAGSVLGLGNFTNLNNLTNARSGFTISISTTSNIYGTFTLGAGSGIDISNKTLYLHGPINIATGATVTSSQNASLIIEGAGSTGSILPVSVIGNLRLKRSGLNLRLDRNLNVKLAFELDPDNTLDFSGYTLSLENQIDNEGILTTDSTGSLSIIGGGTITGSLTATSINNLNLTRNGRYLKHYTDLYIKGYLSLDNAFSFDAESINLTVGGNIEAGSGTIITNSETSLYLVGTGTTAFMGPLDELKNFVISRSVPCSIGLEGDLFVYNQFTLPASASIDLDTRVLKLNGPAHILGTIVADADASLEITGAGSFTGGLLMPFIGRLVINRPGAEVQLLGAMTVHNLLSIPNGTLDFSNQALTLRGNVEVSGIMQTNAQSDLTIAGTGYMNGLPTFTALRNFIFTRNAGYTQGADLTIGGRFELGANSTFNIYGYTLNLNGDVAWLGDVNSNASTKIMVSGTGTVSGSLTADEVHTLELNRIGATLTIGSDLTVHNQLLVANGGVLSFKNRTLALYGQATGAGLLKGGQTGNLFVLGAGTLGAQIMTDSLRTLFMNSSSATLKLHNPLYVHTELSLRAGNALDMRGQLLTLNGSAGIDGSILMNAASSLRVVGSGPITNFPAFDSIQNLNIVRPGFNFTPAASAVVVQGTLELALGASLALQNKALTLNGPVLMAGFFHSDANTQITIGGSGTADSLSIEQLRSLTLNRPGMSIRLKRDMHVYDALNMGQGVLNTGSHVVSLSNAAEITGESNESYVLGTLHAQWRHVGTGGSTFSGIGFSLQAGADDLGSVEVKRYSGTLGIITHNGNASIATNYEVNISGSQPVAGRNISFSWFAQWANGNSFSSQVADIWSRNTSTDPWTLLADNATVQESTGKHTVSVVTHHFSDFTSTQDNTVLPVQLASFAGKRSVGANAASVQLIWHTASEYNNRGFEIQRSLDGETYSSIAFVNGNGSTTQQQTYHHEDHCPTAAYYRLIQHDLDGSQRLLSTTYVSGSALEPQQQEAQYHAGGQMLTWPTLAAGTTITILDASAKVIFETSITSTQDLQLSTSSWPVGIYYVKTTRPDSLLHQRLYIR